MIEQWAVEVIATLRILGISQKEFARLCGYSESYMSQVLRGRKSTDQARMKIQQTLKMLSNQMR